MSKINDQEKEALRARLAEFLERVDIKEPGAKQFPCINKCAHKNGTDDHPSMGIVPDGKTAHCFACGWNGDIFKVAGLIFGLQSFPEQVSKVREVLGEVSTCHDENAPAPTPAPKTLAAPNYDEYYQVCVKRLSQTDYWKKRGFTEDFLKANGVGYDSEFRYNGKGRPSPRLIIPYDDNHYTARAIETIDGQNKRYLKVGPSPFPLYCVKFAIKHAKQAERPIWATEGEIDALSIIYAGGNAFALGGAQNVKNKKAIKTAIESIGDYPHGVIFAADPDETGRDAAQEFVNELSSHGIKATIADLSDAGGIKDANDRLATFGVDDLRRVIEEEEARAKAAPQVAPTPIEPAPIPSGKENAKEWASQQAAQSGVDAGKQSKGKERHLVPVVRTFEDGQPEEVAWFWPERMPRRGIVLLAGHPGAGKSILCMDIAARVTKNADFPDGAHCEPGHVLLLNAEDDYKSKLLPIFMAAHGERAKLHYMPGVRWSDDEGGQILHFTLEDVQALIDAANAIKDLRLIIIDPIGSYFGLAMDSHKDNEVRAMLVPLAEYAEARDCAVLVVAHTRKQGAARADDMVLGSRAFTGLPRAVWHVNRDPDNKKRVLLLPGKNNCGDCDTGLAYGFATGSAYNSETQQSVPAPTLRWEENLVTMDADALCAPAGVGRPAERRKEAIDFLNFYFRELEEAKPRDVQRAAKDEGFSPETLARAVKRMAEEGDFPLYRYRRGKQVYWGKTDKGDEPDKGEDEAPPDGSGG